MGFNGGNTSDVQMFQNPKSRRTMDEYEEEYIHSDVDEIEMRMQEVTDIINRLYRIASKTRSPSVRTVSSKALTFRSIDPDTGVNVFEQFAIFDAQCVRETFRSLGRAGDNLDQHHLVLRLSRAMTTRRRIFAHRKRPQAKAENAANEIFGL